VLSKCLEHGSRTSDDQSIKVFLQQLEVHMKQLKGVARTANDKLLKCLNKKITLTYTVDMLKLPDQSCSRTAKDQLFSLSHTLLSEQVTDSVCNSSILYSVYALHVWKQCLRTGLKSSLIGKHHMKNSDQFREQSWNSYEKHQAFGATSG